MHLYRYHFRSEWQIVGSQEAAREVLRHPEELEAWAPKVCVRSALVAPGVVEAHLRGFMPFVLRTRMTWEEQPDGFVVIAAGDVEGSGRWVMEGRVMSVDQEVRARQWLLRLLSVICRPLCEANHRWLMSEVAQALNRRLLQQQEQAIVKAGLV